MNSNDRQLANKENKRSEQKVAPADATPGPLIIPAKLDVLEAELAVIASRPAPAQENAARKNS